MSGTRRHDAQARACAMAPSESATDLRAGAKEMQVRSVADEHAVTGVVLAGGRGRRMGEADKGLQLLGEQPLVRHVLERLAPQVDEVLINANRNADHYRSFGFPVVADLFPGFAGPLAGLHAALASAAQPLVVTVPCDAPRLPRDLVVRLRAALCSNDADLAFARTFDQLQPVFCLCRRHLLANLSVFLANGGRQPVAWYRTVRSLEVRFDDEHAAFCNINTRADLDAL